MSTVKTNNVQIGQSVTATNNFTWYQPASPDGTVRLGNGNSGSVTDLVTLTSAGNLGIGTSSPAAKLDVRSGASPNLAAVLVGLSGSNNYYAANTHIWQNGASAETMRLDSSGNLGIGTSSPGTKLHVLGSGGSGAISVGDSTGAAQYQYMNFGGSSAGQDGWQLGRSSTSSGLGGNGAFYLYDIKNNTTRLSVDTSGNLGLGVTPSAWNSSLKALQVQTTTIGANNGSWSLFGYNTYYGASGYNYVLSDYAVMYQQGAGQHQWYTAPSGTAGNAISFTQAMTLDASGNLGIGTTTPGAVLHIKGSNGFFAQFLNSTGNTGEGVVIGSGSGLGRISSNGASTALTLEINGTERARIDSSGNLLVGTTTALQPGVTINTNYIQQTLNSATNSNHYYLYNQNATNNGYRFYVKLDGGIANYSANNTNLSDERVKTAITPASPWLTKINAIEVVNFKYKDQSHDDSNLGVIAQQVLSVAPELVDEDGFGELPEDGAPLMAIYETDLKYAMLKAIQELSAELNELKKRIN